MAGKVKKYVLISTLVVLTVLAAIGFGLVPVNLFFAKAAISSQVADRLGMDLEIQGPLRFRFGPVPALTASGITLRSAGNDTTPLLKIERITARPRLAALIEGDIFLRQLLVEGVATDYCLGGWPEPEVRPASDSNNNEGTPAIGIDQFSIRNLQLICTNEQEALEFLPRQLELEAVLPHGGSIDGRLAAEFEEHELNLSFSAGSLRDLLENTPNYPFKLTLEGMESTVAASGSVSRPLSEPEIHFEGELNSALLENAIGSPELSVSGIARDFGSRPYFDLEASLIQFDLARVSGGPGDPEESGEPVNFRPVYEFLTRFDARTRLEIGRLLNAPVAIDQLHMEASLDNGILELTHAGILLAGSPVTATALLDEGEDCIRLNSELHLDHLSLDLLNRFIDRERDVGGTLEALELGSTSCGDTPDQHIESLQLAVSARGIAPAWNGDDLPLAFHTLEADLNWTQPGMLSFDGELLGEPFSVTAGLGSIESFQSDNLWPLKIEARGVDSRLDLDGAIGLLNDIPALDVDLQIETSRFGSLHGWLGANPENSLALKSRASFKIDQGGMSIDDVDVRLGNSDLKGSLVWNGPDGGLPANLKLRSSRLDVEQLTTLFADDAEARQAENWQWAERFTHGEWLEEWFSFPALDIDLLVQQVDGIWIKGNDASLQVSLRDRQVNNGRLKYRHDGLLIEGKIDANLQQRPWTLDFETTLQNIDIGHLLAVFEVSDQVEARAQSAVARYESKGHNLKSLTENSRLDVRLEFVQWAFDAGAENRRHEFGVSSLEVNIAPGSDSTWLASGFLNDIPFRTWIKTPSLPATFNPASPLPLTLAISSGEDITMVNAVVDPKSPAGRKVSLSVSGEVEGPDPVDLSRLEPPLKDFHLSSDITVGDDQALFEKLQVQVGTSSAAGSISIRYEEPHYLFDIDISSPFLETDDLVKWAQDWRNDRGTSQPGDPQAEDPEPDAKGGTLALLDRTVDDFTGSNVFNFKLGVDQLNSSGQLLGKALLVLKVDDQEILLDPLEITNAEARTTVRYHGRNTDPGIEYKLDMLVEGIQYGGLLRLLNPEAKAQGEMFLKTSLVTNAPSADRAVNHLAGTFDLAVFPRDSRAEFLDLWASNLVFALLPSTGAEKKLNCMVSRFEIENGVMQSKNTFLDSTEVIVRAKGSIDLASRELDLWIAPQSKREKFLSVSTPLAVTGPFSDFSVGVAPGGFLATIARWYYGLIYVPWKWLTGERFPADGIATCYKAMDWELPENSE